MAENIEFTGSVLGSADLAREVKNMITNEVKLAQTGNEAQLKRVQENSDSKWKEVESVQAKLAVAEAKAAKTEEDMKDLETKIANLERIGAMNNIAPETKELAIYNAKALVNGFARTSTKAKINGFKNYDGTIKESLLSFYQKELVSREIKDYGFSSIDNLVSSVKTSPSVLRSDIGEFGEFLCPIEWSATLDHQIIETTPIRELARVQTIGGKTIRQPIRQGVPTAVWEGETDTAGVTQSNYTSIEMSPYALTNQTIVTWDLIQDAAYNISDELIADNSIAFAQAEGYASVKGSGAHMSLGFTQDPNVPHYANTYAATYSINGITYPVSWEDIVLMSGQLKTGYKPMFAFNRRTMAYLRTLVDSNNRPIFLGAFGNIENGPMTINGYSFNPEFIDMDDAAGTNGVTNGNPIVFADFAKFYRIVDRTSVILIRDELTRAGQREVVYTLMKWTYGAPVIKEAGIVMVRNG